VKIPTFWDITPYSPLNVNRCYARTYPLQANIAFIVAIFWDVAPQSVCEPTFRRNVSPPATCWKMISCSVDFRSWRWRWYVPPKLRFTYRLHGAISQKITFKTTACENLKPYIDLLAACFLPVPWDPPWSSMLLMVPPEQVDHFWTESRTYQNVSGFRTKYVDILNIEYFFFI
jgi:hypothetical protein